MAIRFQKPLAVALLLLVTGCGPFFVKPGSRKEKAEPPPVTEVTASTREEVLAQVTSTFRKKPERRVYRVPGDHGWIEEYELLKIEDLGVESVLVGKRKTPKNQMTCRITSKVTRWKFYGKKTKGEPDVREVVEIRRYNF